MPDLFEPLALARGPAMKNRFMLAPMTNRQSHEDGTLSDAELHWLSLRAKGGFGLVMTAGAQVQPEGKGFSGQLGAFGDHQIPGLARLAQAIKAHGSVSSVQLLHAGSRSPPEIVGVPVSASDDPETGARALSTAEVEQIVEDFASASARAETAGFDGVEIHGAHGYLISQFLSPEINRREDRYGGSFENRTRFLLEIVAGIRDRCGPDFQLGLRLSPERFGLGVGEARELCGRLLAEGRLDFLDLSLWDVFKEPVEPEFQGRPLMSWFTDLPRGSTRLGVAGRVTSPVVAAEVMARGADFVLVGRSAIVHHDFPERARDQAFTPVATPVTAEYLTHEGVSPAFADYLRDTFKLVEPA